MSFLKIKQYLCGMIFYFSGTGNTKWAAQKVADYIEEELVNIPDVFDGDCHFELKMGERIGFCFPVHGWRPPLYIRQFIRKLSFDNADGHFCWALCTAGDDIGETMDILQQDLEPKGLQVASALSLVMPESYVGLPFMDVDTPEKEKLKKEKADEKLEAFLPYLQNRREGIFELDLGHWPRINSRLLGAFFVKRLVTDRRFHVNSNRCVKCGICADVCPEQDIQGGLGHEPEWKHNGKCLTCFSCYHHCPHHAIEFGRQTYKKGQYFFNRNKIH